MKTIKDVHSWYQDTSSPPSPSCGQKGEDATISSSVTHLGPIWTGDTGTQPKVLAESKLQWTLHVRY